jgi:hypothetical protein
LRRAGHNAHPDQRCYIVHFDEESVMEVQELRNLFFYLARHPLNTPARELFRAFPLLAT